MSLDDPKESDRESDEQYLEDACCSFDNRDHRSPARIDSNHDVEKESRTNERAVQPGLAGRCLTTDGKACSAVISFGWVEAGR